MMDVIQKRGYICNGMLSLPNSVDVLSDGSIIVANAGHDQICLFSSDGDLLRSEGGLGFGQYRMKEPVAVAVSPDDKIFVADWHNHRIVMYTSELKYNGEFGHYGQIVQEDVYDYIDSATKFYYKLSRSGVYKRYFFSDADEQVRTNASIIERIQLFINGLFYWSFIRYPSLFKSITAAYKHGHMNKPNGIAFLGTKVYVTQKNARCLTVHRETSEGFEFIKSLDSPRNDEPFGRLGNIHASSRTNRLYVCDERNNTIWIINSGGEYINDIQNIGDQTFLPFSCCELEDDLLAIISSKMLLVISLDDKEITYQEEMGELHGVELDEKNGFLYVVERSNDRIAIYDVCT